MTAAQEFATTGERPYSLDSPWNTPIPDAVADPDSDVMISLISANGPLRSDPTQYTFPLYFADQTTPRVTMTCTEGVNTNNLDGTRTFSGTRTVVDPVPLRQEMPALPPQLRQLAAGGREGEIELTVDETGRVTTAVMRKSIYRVYDDLLLRAARNWRYRPGTIDGRPVGRTVTVVVHLD